MVSHLSAKTQYREVSEPSLTLGCKRRVTQACQASPSLPAAKECKVRILCCTPQSPSLQEPVELCGALFRGKQRQAALTFWTVFLQIQEDPSLCGDKPCISAVTMELSKETLDTMLDGLGRIRDQLSAVANK